MKIKKSGVNKISKDIFLYGSTIVLIALIVFVSQVIQNPVTSTKSKAANFVTAVDRSNCRLSCNNLDCVYGCLKEIFKKTSLECQIVKSFEWKRTECAHSDCDYNVSYVCLDGFTGTFGSPFISDENVAKEMAGIICANYSSSTCPTNTPTPTTGYINDDNMRPAATNTPTPGSGPFRDDGVTATNTPTPIAEQRTLIEIMRPAQQ